MSVHPGAGPSHRVSHFGNSKPCVRWSSPEALSPAWLLSPRSLRPTVRLVGLVRSSENYSRQDLEECARLEGRPWRCCSQPFLHVTEGSKRVTHRSPSCGTRSKRLSRLGN